MGARETAEVKLLDLQAQFETIRDDVMAAIGEVVESQQFILGPKVAELERELAAYCSCEHAVGVSSGTDALLVALTALGIGPGDEVVTPAFSFFASASAIYRLGARPVFVDIDPDTYNVDPAAFEAAITDHTKAVIPVHLFGQCADMTAIMRIAAKNGIAVVEDAAQAIGAEHAMSDQPVGKRAGSFGTFGCLSFFPTKNLGAFGEGGMLTTHDKELADRARMLRHHGDAGRYDHVLVGGNFRLEAIQAAVLLVKLAHLGDAGLVPARVRLPVERPGRHVYNQYVIDVDRRDALCVYLAERGIGHSVYYPKPLHLQPCFEALGHKPGDFPAAERACQRVLALPIYAELPERDARRVVDTIRTFFAGR
jgi:dTDP-4-amino-4,6-dideoxygalactose transaminase